MSGWKKYRKAILGFVVAFIGALVAQVQAGTPLTSKVILLALGTALVTSYGVYQVPNEA